VTIKYPGSFLGILLSCAQGEWLSELLKYAPAIKTSIKSLETSLNLTNTKH
jgi:hypothetical protein